MHRHRHLRATYRFDRRSEALQRLFEVLRLEQGDGGVVVLLEQVRDVQEREMKLLLRSCHVPIAQQANAVLDAHGSRSLALMGSVQWTAEDRNGVGYRHGIRFTKKQDDRFPFYTYSFFCPQPEAN